MLLIWSAIPAAIAAVLLHGRIPQDPGYHLFADQRVLLGVRNCLNVLSNFPFLLVGTAGLWFVLRSVATKGANSFLERKERWPYAVLFLGVALTCFGSSYYHLAPSNDRLVWDRVPMTLGFTGLLAAVIAERISVRAGLRLLFPLVVTGVWSVFYWHQTELAGKGDLRIYLLVQFLPVVAILLLMLLFPPRYTRGRDLLVVLGLYALAKSFELCDRQIFTLGHVFSGHTLKHLAAVVSVYWILRMLERRAPREASVRTQPERGGPLKCSGARQYDGL